MNSAGQITKEILNGVSFPSIKTIKNREKFLIEELKELQVANQTALRMLEESADYVKDVDYKDIITDQTDAYLDIIYVAVGGLLELGLNPDQIENCMIEVCNANSSKFPPLSNANLAKYKASHPDLLVEPIEGRDNIRIIDPKTRKVKKPFDWSSPESRIKKILFPKYSI